MKAIWLLPLLLLPTPTAGQAPSHVTDAPSIATTGAFFALSVEDMEASTRWYVEKLGLRVTMPRSRMGKAAATVLEGGGLIVELVQHDDALPLTRPAPAVQGGSLFVHGIFKAGFVVEDFDATIALLRARQVEIAFGPFPKRPTQRANAIIKDNAGNFIQIFGK